MSIINRIKSVFKRVFKRSFLSTIIGVVLGIIAGHLLGKIFFDPIEQYFCFNGETNWVQFLSSRNEYENPYITLPDVKEEGLTAYGNGAFRSLIPLERFVIPYDKLAIVDDTLDKKTYLEDTLLLEKFPSGDMATLILDYNREGYYYKKTIAGFDSIVEDTKPIASLCIDIPSDEYVIIKCVNEKMDLISLGEFPASFDMSYPSINAEILFNEDLPSDTCSALLIDCVSSTNTKFEISTDFDYALFVNGVSSTKDTAYNKNIAFKIEKTGILRYPLQEKHNNMNFDIGIIIDGDAGDNTYFNMHSASKYLFLMSPDGNLAIGRNKYSINSLDRLEFSGKFQFILSYRYGLLPKMKIEGMITSCKINRQELILSKWGYVDVGIKSAMYGGILGGIITLLMSIYHRLSNKSNSVVQQVYKLKNPKKKYTRLRK